MKIEVVYKDSFFEKHYCEKYLFDGDYLIMYNTNVEMPSLEKKYKGTVYINKNNILKIAVIED